MGHIIRQDMTLLHLNIRHLYTNRTELTQLLNELTPDIIALNETHLGPQDKYTQRGYTIFRRDRNRRGGGVALMCRDTLPASHIKHPPQFNHIEHVTIKIHITNFPLYITSIYLPPDTDFPHDFFTHIDAYHKSVVVGDVNAHHKNLGDDRNNRAGSHLLNFIRNSNHHHIPTGPTRLPDQRHNYLTTKPDKILVSTHILHKINDITTLAPLANTDHCSIYATIATRHWAPTTQPQPRTVFKYQHADWELYRNYITDNLPQLHNINNMESLIRADELLLQVTNEARLRAVPHKQKTATNNKRELPPDIIRLIKTKRRAYRLYMRTRTDNDRRLYRGLQNDVKNAITDFEANKRLRLVTSLDKNLRHDPAKFWKILKRLRGTTAPQYPIKVNNNYVFNTTDKLEAFHDRLQEIHNQQDSPEFDHAHYQRITDTVQARPDLYFPLDAPAVNGAENPLTTDFTIEETRQIIHKTNNKSPGPDNIPNILIRQYPDQAIEFLTAIYNASFRLGALPPRWKHAHILLFPKPGKDLTDPGNYRPISLTVTICKIMERMINRRLLNYLTENDIIPDTQAGFRPGVDIIDQILKIITPIELGWTRGMTSIMVALDMKRAFDSVWLDGLRYKLHNTGMPHMMIRWLSDFIRDRTAQVKINNSLSTPITIHGGVAQGTVLSPVLYNIYVADIPQPQRQTFKLGQFADDTILTATGQGIRTLSIQLNQSLIRLVAWLDKWRLTINTDKTQVMLLKPRRYPSLTQRNRNRIRIRNTRLDYRNELTYLGVTLTRKLTLTKQIPKLRQRIKLATKLLHNLTGRPHERASCLPKTNIIIYKSFIRPALLYASQLYTRLPASSLSGLGATERRLIRKAYLLPRNTSNAATYRLTRITPLTEYIRRKNIQYVHKAIRRPYSQHFFVPPPPVNPTITLSNLYQQYAQYRPQPRQPNPIRP